MSAAFSKKGKEADNLPASQLDAMQGSREARSKPYKRYGERALERLTQQHAKSTDRVSGSARKQVGAVRSRGWGPLEAVLLGFVGFLVMQLLVGILLGVFLATFEVPETVLDSNVFNFGIYALVSLAAGAPIWFFLRRRELDLASLGFGKIKSSSLWLSLPAFAIYFIGATLVYNLVARVAPGIDLDQVQELGFEATEHLPQLVLIFISLVIVPPLVEEAIFRGFVFRGLRSRLAFWPAALISGIGFGLAHWQLNIALDTAVLGVVSAGLVERTGSLWPSIGLHGLKNLIAFALIFIFGV